MFVHILSKNYNVIITGSRVCVERHMKETNTRKRDTTKFLNLKIVSCVLTDLSCSAMSHFSSMVMIHFICCLRDWFILYTA